MLYNLIHNQMGILLLCPQSCNNDILHTSLHDTHYYALYLDSRQNKGYLHTSQDMSRSNVPMDLPYPLIHSVLRMHLPVHQDTHVQLPLLYLPMAFLPENPQIIPRLRCHWFLIMRQSQLPVLLAFSYVFDPSLLLLQPHLNQQKQVPHRLPSPPLQQSRLI